MPISPEQLRGARAMLGLSREEAAKLAGVSERTLIDFERRAEGRTARKSTLLALKAALEGAGIEFIAENGGGPGVRLK